MQGFLQNSAEIFSQRGMFLNHHFNNYMVREEKRMVEAYEVGFENRSSNLKKIFGEFFEREVLINTNVSKNLDIYTSSLVERTTKKLPTGIFIAKDRFVDSCGMASHTNSSDVIKTSFFEFFERQSLITSYLSKNVSPEIILGKDIALEKTEIYLKNYVDTIRYFNISLSNRIYVILCIGYGDNKCIGLGTSDNMQTAIIKSQIEALQYFATDFSKYNSNSSLFDSIDNKKDLYHSKFDSLQTKEFINLYSYLLDGTAPKEIGNDINQNIDSCFDFDSFIAYCNTELKMVPLIAVFYPNEKIAHLKVVKIHDENWFPHINPEYYKSSSIDFVSDVLNTPLDKSITYLPFP
ncbi:YcaO-like family protein [Enterococcus rotai]|uniref:YcaO-like family protein n=1 Tax=Enterococcus rotai TaxID=118060 RepID=UPI0032B34A92